VFAAVDASLRDRSEIHLVWISCLSAFLRKQSFETAILAGAKKSEIPQRGVDHLKQYIVRDLHQRPSFALHHV